ncbi:MAG: Protease Do [Parcubacteria group bacterium GW2011_GWA2_43_11]|nr:MAG: Protease Do [Parcubacteria group bacterium GW2011_GWC2_42_11]KKS86264.1 MAG: Protease Do [Parcubacteria group bacterium GW2011_GWA2_43_11]
MDYSGTVEKIKNSIALVLTVNPQGNITSKGSGFVYMKKGLLVTCNHVVANNDGLKIRLDDTAEFFDAKVAIRDEEHDLALLKYDENLAPTSIPLLKVDIKSIKEGVSVLFAGYPLSLFNLTTHQGILSGIITDATGVVTYLIDGTVNSGNSGCPLMDANGAVIGVVNAKRRERSDLLSKVEALQIGALSLHGIDLVELHQALISNVQLGMGYAVPCSYIPSYKDGAEPPKLNKSEQKVKQERKKK